MAARAAADSLVSDVHCSVYQPPASLGTRKLKYVRVKHTLKRVGEKIIVKVFTAL